ncbi:DUF4352 domain-containing protein [Bacteroides heparinolyticus]|uniref:DUF4352 domain-containing protein n=1 Tax=Prevotella heparinolytica TaxID=28113 RepID=UPI003FA18919
MKSTKLLWTIIVCLVIGFCISLLLNLGIINLPKGIGIPNKTLKVFHLTNMKMTLDKEWSLPKNIAIVRLDFTIENITKEPQTLYKNDLSLFDYNDCQYSASTTFDSKLNPLLFSETINPNTKKELSIIFEVPQDELYSVGYSDNIERIGKQSFVDKIKNIKCEYVTFQEMVEVRKHLLNQPPKSASSQTKEIIALKIEFEEPVKSAHDFLIKEGTNPTNEIVVDLNDFLGTPDDETDWNYTELSADYCKALASKGVYYSKSKGAWVMEKSRKGKEDAKIAERRRQEAERQYANQATCRIVYELNGRQAKNISSVENADSQEGVIYLKIEVSPNGDVVSCEIDPRSIIDDSDTRELCISSAKNIKFNAIDSKRNQSGIIRYIFIK